MSLTLRRLVSGGLLAACLLAPCLSSAKTSTWKDAQGATFRGEPVAIVGPFALFETSRNQGKRMLLRGLTPEDCRRVQAELAARPPRAERLSEAKSDATADLVGNVMKLEGRNLVKADLTTIPEPEVVLVLGGSHNTAEGWQMSNNLTSFYQRIQRVYPGVIQAVFLGTRHNETEHRAIATGSSMPWLVMDLERGPNTRVLSRYIPKEGASMVLLSRDGVPLFGGRADDAASMRAICDQISEFLWQIDPTNPATWADRLHYLKATRPVAFAASQADPVLVGNPLRAEGLREYGVKRIAATLAVTAEGKVMPTLHAKPGDFPREVAEPLRAALSQALVAPAIAQGKAVAGSLEYLLEVPPANPARENETLWLHSTSYPVIPIEQWLVLRPIKVSEQDFGSEIEKETAAGTVVFKAMEVNSGKISRAAQMSAFNSDWFTEAGADSVRPKAGDRQRIDADTELTWQRVKSVDGFVDLQSGLMKDYTVGYAWAEFTAAKATEAWLGLGSDDGVKIWLNGELVHDRWIRRVSRLDDDVVPLKLNAGPNRILIKIQNATGDWSFIYRLRTKP